MKSHLPGRRMRAGLFLPAAAALAVALPMPTQALGARSADGAWQVETDDARAELVVRGGAEGRELRRIALADRSGRRGRLAWIIDLPRRHSFLAGFESLPEAWELPYGQEAGTVFNGLVHDYRLGEGVAESGPLPVRRIPLERPLPLPQPDDGQRQVSWHEAGAPGLTRVLNLDVRRVVSERADTGPSSSPAGAGNADATRLEPVLVVAAASRVEEDAQNVPATVSVIDRGEAFREVVGNLRDLLRYEPGVSMESSATRFGLGNLAIRGLDGNRVQMTVDGIRLPESYRVGSFSSASRNALDLGLLRRVEIVRGPASAIHGSDALAGVVAFETLSPGDYLRDGRGVGGEAFAVHTGADHATSRGGALALAAGTSRLLLGAQRVDGRESANRGDVGGTGAARTEPNPQDVRGESQLLKWVVPAAPGWQLTLAYDRFARDVATDVLSLNPQSSRTVDLQGDDHARRQRASASVSAWEAGPFSHLTLTAYAQSSLTQQDTAETRASTTAACLSAPGAVRCLREPRFRYESGERGVVAIGESQPRWLGLEHRAVVGAEFSRTRTDERRDGRQTNLVTGEVTTVVGGEPLPARDFPVTDTDRFGAFAQDAIVAPGSSLTWIPGLRADAFRVRPRPDATFTASSGGREVKSLSDEAVSPKLGVLYRAAESVTLTAQLATGFRAPPAADLNLGLTSLPAGYAVVPNPDLRSETSRGAEAGVRFRATAVEAGLAAYYTRYSDLIVSRTALPCPADPACVPGATGTFQSRNVSSARIYGVEGRLAWRPAPGWTLRGAFSVPRGDDLGKDQPLNAIDPAQVVAGLAYDSAAWGVALHVTHALEKRRLDRSAGIRFVPPAWTTVDLTAWMKPLPSLEIAAGLFNVTDRRYWLWADVRGLTNVAGGFDRYTQPGRNAGINVRWRF